MKFVCDRCKTRYSIGDDRVRGKILKIRCKNCANVITVREGMSADEPEVAGAAGAAGPSRTARPTTMAPPAAHSTPANGANGTHGGALAAKPAPAAMAAPAPKPPAALDEEWYVSIDGDQQGPYSLAEAQRWISSKGFDAELHCWSEGFDDWLPVDKVSHFRGLRKKPPAPTPPPAPPATPPRAPTRGTGGPIAARSVGAKSERVEEVEDEPKPLFAATMASLERQAQQAEMTPRPVKATPAVGVPSLSAKGTAPAPGMTAAMQAPAKNGKSGPVAAIAPAVSARETTKDTGPAPLAAVRPVQGRSVSGFDESQPTTQTPPFGSELPPSKAAGFGAFGSVGPLASPPPPPLLHGGGPAPSPAYAPPSLAPTPSTGPLAVPPAFPAPSAFATAAAPPQPSPFPSPSMAPPAFPAPSSFAPAHAPHAPSFLGTPLASSSPSPSPSPSPASSPSPYAFDSPSSPSPFAAFDTPAPTPPAPAAPARSDDDDARDARGARMSPAAKSFDDDSMEIGEVSRVVNLADLMRNPRKDRTAPVARVTGSPARPSVGRMTGATPRLPTAAIADGTAPAPLGIPGSLDEALPTNGVAAAAMLGNPSVAEAALIPPPHVAQRSSMIILFVVALLLVGGAAAVVIYIVLNGDDQPLALSNNNSQNVDTYRPDDPVFPGYPQPNGSAGSGSNMTAEHPHPHPYNPNNGHPNNPLIPTGSNGSNPTQTGPDPLGALKPEEVEDMYGKSTFLTQRCWEHAQKKNPYLPKDVKRVVVTLTIDGTGIPTKVDLAGIPQEDGGLGGCLQTMIHNWKFRPTKDGLTAKITMVFQ